MSRTHTKAHKTGKLKKMQQKAKKTLKRTLKKASKRVPKRTLKGKKTKRTKGGSITDLWGRNLPETSSSTLGDIVNGIKNPSLHGEGTF